MQEVVDKVLLLPRYTSFAGATSFYTAPMNVREYARAIFTYTACGGLGSTPPTVVVKIEQSADLEIWTEVAPDINVGGPVELAFKFEWMRIKLTVSGSDPCITCWCVGDFVYRHA
jgi:hypothetical protein